MKRFKKGFILLIVLICVSLAACGNNGEDNSTESADYMAADELTGVWADGDKNMLQLDTAQNTYTYRTWYGRIGSGSLITPGNDENVRQLDFDDFYYDFIIADGGFTLRQNGENEEENLNGAHFVRTDGEMVQIPPETLDGMWQNAAGETLVIDTGRMAYIACSKQGISSGTVAEKEDGKGLYLFLNGFAYPRISANGHSFELFFTPSDTQSPDGSYSGVFYKDGKADEYAVIDKKDFVSQDGHMWYFDGVQYYALPDGYTVKDDGFAYDSGGNKFAAGWKSQPYDPAGDWGENWAESW